MTAPFILSATSLRFDSSSLEFFVLDQTFIPLRQEWRKLETPQDAVEAIQCLAVRGAPLIGVVAVLSLGQWLCKKTRNKAHSSWDEIFEMAHLLKSSRPTAVNLARGVDRWVQELKAVANNAEGWSSEKNEDAPLVIAKKIFDEDVRLCLEMGRAGAQLLKEGERVLTICNTGALATVGAGTALSVIAEGFRLGKIQHVYACETRPLLQGARLTSWELQQLGIPFTLIGDSMAAALMAKKKVTSIFVGADRIAMNGDFANKVGTYSLAVNARYHHIPFYTVAPSTTLDFSCATGAEIPIEERDAAEMQGCVIPGVNISWTPVGTPVWNPSFDVTPLALLSGIVVDSKVLLPDDIFKGGLREFRAR